MLCQISQRECFRSNAMMDTLKQVTEIPVNPNVFWGFVITQLGVFVGAFLKLQASVRELLVWKNERTRPIEEYYKDRDATNQKIAILEERIKGISDRIEHESNAIQNAIKDLKQDIVSHRSHQ